MWPVSERFQQAIALPHTLATRLDVRWPDGSTTSDVPFLSGSVTVDAGSRVRRSCTVELPASLMDLWRDVVLGGAELRPYRGVEYIDTHVELCPLGVFPVRDVDADLLGMTPGVLTAPDRYRRVQREEFYAPRVSTDAATVPAQISELVRGAFVEDVGFSDLTGSDLRVPFTVWPRDRGAAVDELAASIGAELFFDVLGTPTLRPIPMLTEPVWRIYIEGDVVLTAKSKRSDGDVYSAVVVNPSRTDGTAQFERVVVEDTNPRSFTFVGKFGHVPYFPAPNQSVDTAEKALAYAQGSLALVTGYGESIELGTLVNAALDAGDTLEVHEHDDTRITRHVIDGFTVPLNPEGSMSMKTRSQALAPAAES